MPRDLNVGPVAGRVAALNARYRHHSATAVLEHSLKDVDLGRVALVSSFGAESVVLLHLVSVIAPETPVLFIDTEMLFAETLAYVKTRAAALPSLFATSSEKFEGMDELRAEIAGLLA